MFCNFSASFEQKNEVTRLSPLVTFNITTFENRKSCRKSLTDWVLSGIIFLVLCENKRIYGELAEWSKAHDWKSCRRDERLQGSNP